MHPVPRSPKDVLPKILLREKIVRSEFETFRSALENFRTKISERESEEFNKNLVAEFLRDAFYRDTHLINTKSRIDLAIYSGKDSSSSVAVLIEAKSPSNKSEMVRPDDLNRKALHELVSYFLRERFIDGNTGIRHLIITNCREWFVFDAADFEKCFSQNKALVRDFKDWERNAVLFTKTDDFYKQIAEPAIAGAGELPFVRFDLRERLSEKEMQHLFKLLSPTHLLKLPLANDSNSLNRGFYNELLHIIGLEEKDDAGKKIITRAAEERRAAGTLLESTIYQLQQCYVSDESAAFDAALDLIITWINRILFLKLLEAQLVRYNRNPASRFLSIDRIPDYDALSELFFSVLAKKENERVPAVREKFSEIPYLNSSLFELSESERKYFRITGIRDAEIPYYAGTVLVDSHGKRRRGNAKLLAYLFDFLDAFDFGDTGDDDSGFRSRKKDLISASVLGLIFEKLNGYKDGSFFTPGFITQYICRETIRSVVVRKFNEKYAWNCRTLTDVYNEIRNADEANALIDSLRICDPAVGSGHFLVSALNEIIAVKSELGILRDKNGKRLRDCVIEVENDELVVTDADGELFNYVPANKESARIQETLFREKRRIIENCLFGADINGKSVHICRLRLWIELLKNAFYREDGTLETLPNIDINIKCGNSLISRYPVEYGKKVAGDKNDSRKTAELWSRYRDAVRRYKRENDKEAKREVDRLISEIKAQLSSLIQLELDFEGTGRANKQKIDEQNLFRNSLEWTIEFPEIIDDAGTFLGFDLIIGNPPYIQLQKMGDEATKLEQLGYETFNRMGDIYCLFYERGISLLKPAGTLGFITSNKWMRAGYGEKTRGFFLKCNPTLLVDLKENIFDEATVDTNILVLRKEPNAGTTTTCAIDTEESKKRSVFVSRNAGTCRFDSAESWVILSPVEQSIKRKIEAAGTPLKDWDISINYGIKTGFNEAFIISGAKREEILAACRTEEEKAKTAELIRPILRGRDIKRYSYVFADQYIIATFPSRHYDIEDFPALKNYFLSIGIERLEQSGKTHIINGEKIKSRKKTNNKWFETQDSISYWEDFSKQKIVWAELARTGNAFAFDSSQMFVGNTAYMLTCTSGDENELRYLLGVLNSKAILYYLDLICSRLDENGWRWLRQFVELLPVPKPRGNVQKIIAALNSKQFDFVEACVFEMYGLTQEEKNVISEKFSKFTNKQKISFES